MLTWKLETVVAASWGDTLLTYTRCTCRSCLLVVCAGGIFDRERKKKEKKEKKKKKADTRCWLLIYTTPIFSFFPCHVQLYNSLISLTGPPPAPAPAPQQKMVLLTRNRDDDDARESIGELCTGYSRRKLVLWLSIGGTIAEAYDKAPGRLLGNLCP